MSSGAQTSGADGEGMTAAYAAIGMSSTLLESAPSRRHVGPGGEPDRRALAAAVPAPSIADMMPNTAPRAGRMMAKRMDSDNVVMSDEGRGGGMPMGMMMAEAAAPPDGGSYASVDRLVVKNGQVDVTVESLGDSRDAVNEAVKAVNGIVVRSVANGAFNVYMQLRVPADTFDQVMAKVRSLGTVMSENEAAEDVTQEFVDRSARAETLDATRRQLTALLQRVPPRPRRLLMENEDSAHGPPRNASGQRANAPSLPPSLPRQRQCRMCSPSSAS